MWPVNASTCIELMRTFNPKKQKLKPVEEPTLPTIPWVNPSTPTEVGKGIKKWVKKIRNADILWSDPIRPEQLDTFTSNTLKVCTRAELNSFELTMYQKRRQDDLAGKTSRKRLKKAGPGWGLTNEEAQKQIEEKRKAAEIAEAKKKRGDFMKLWRVERNDINKKGIEAWHAERARKKKVKEMRKSKLDVPVELLTPITDPRKEWRATDDI